ncbi:MAG TPA: hypothetical protein VL175_04170 [Pirellulales bacterium]|jgi:hypothetical protein|nr:hypothetical protein [Pirellulales bacterium]
MSEGIKQLLLVAVAVLACLGVPTALGRLGLIQLHWAYSLEVVLAMSAAIGAGYLLPVENTWFLFSVPLAAGLAFGAFVPRWHPVLLIALVLGPLAGLAFMAVWIAIVASLSDVGYLVFYLPVSFFYGALPALIGAVLSNSLKPRSSTAAPHSQDTTAGPLI